MEGFKIIGPKYDLKILKSKYENKKLILDLEINEKYIGKEIDLILQYGVYVRKTNPVHYFESIGSQKIIAQKNINLEFNIGEIKDIYLGESINIGYCIKINDNFLSLSKNKNIFIEKIENIYVYDIKNLKEEYKNKDEYSGFTIANGVFENNKKDDYKIQDVIMNLNIFQKIFLFIIPFLFFGFFLFLHFIDKDNDFNLVVVFIFTIMANIAFFVFFFKSYLGIKYCKLDFTNLEIKNGINLKDIVNGVCKVDTNNIILQISIYNYETGIYIGYYGNKKDRIYFNEDISKKIIYEKQIKQIFSGDSISSFIEGTLDMEDISKCLFPIIEINDNYGLYAIIEVSIIHPKLMDIRIEKDIIIPKGNLNFKKELNEPVLEENKGKKSIFDDYESVIK